MDRYGLMGRVYWAAFCAASIVTFAVTVGAPRMHGE